MIELIPCAYAHCDKVLPKTEMTEIGEEKDFLCPSCLIKFENSYDTGYCPMSCLLGYGCDQSC